MPVSDRHTDKIVIMKLFKLLCTHTLLVLSCEGRYGIQAVFIKISLLSVGHPQKQLYFRLFFQFAREKQYNSIPTIISLWVNSKICYSRLVLNEHINTLKTGPACNYTAYDNDLKSPQVEIANQIVREETNQLSIPIGAVMHTHRSK